MKLLAVLFFLSACVVGDEAEPGGDVVTVDSEEAGGCSWGTVHTFANIDDYVAYEPAKACKEITGIPVARPVENPGGTINMQCCYREPLEN